jgi:hypothetical protein
VCFYCMRIILNQLETSFVIKLLSPFPFRHVNMKMANTLIRSARLSLSLMMALQARPQHSSLPKNLGLTKKGTNCMLNLWGHLSQELVRVQVCHSDKSLCRLHNLLCSSTLQGLGLQSQRHEVETASCLLYHSRVLPKVIVSDLES